MSSCKYLKTLLSYPKIIERKFFGCYATHACGIRLTKIKLNNTQDDLLTRTYPTKYAVQLFLIQISNHKSKTFKIVHSPTWLAKT